MHRIEPQNMFSYLLKISHNHNHEKFCQEKVHQHQLDMKYVKYNNINAAK